MTDYEEVVRLRTKLHEVESTLTARCEALEKENRIINLSVPLEEELAAKIDELLKYLAQGDGFTFNGIARLLVECQKRMASDWTDIGNERRQRKDAESRCEALEQENTQLLQKLSNTDENRVSFAAGYSTALDDALKGTR